MANISNRSRFWYLLVGGGLLEAAHPCRDDVAGVPGVPGGAGCRGAGPRGQELLGVGAGPREPSVRHGQGVGVLVRVPVPAAMWGRVSGNMPSENKLDCNNDFNQHFNST